MRGFVRALALLSSLMLYTAQDWAGVLQQTWSARASEEYVTNPSLNSAGQSQSIWRSTLAPGYLLTDTLGANVLHAGLDIAFVKSSNTTLFANKNNPSATFGWKRTDDRGGFGMLTTYNRASTLKTEPSATGLVSANSTRTSRDLSADWIRELSQHTTLTLNGAYAKISYGGSGNSVSLSDYASQSSGLKLNYVWNEQAAIFANLSYVNLVPTGSGPGSHQYNAGFGLDWNASERFEWILQGGPSRLESMGVTTISMQGGVTMNYKGQQSNLSLSANRQSTPSGLGAIIIADQASGDLSYDLSERSKTGMDLAWRKSNYLTGNINRTAGVWLHRDLSPFWGMKIYFNRNTSVWGGLDSASSNTLGVFIAYTNF